MKFPFQTILIVICVVAFIGAILVFSGIIPIRSSSNATEPSGAVVVWGVYPTTLLQPYLDQISRENTNLSVTYQEINPSFFQAQLISAMADDRHPDLVIATQEELLPVVDKLYSIPYTTYPERSFRDTFVDGAALFLGTEGVRAIPLVVDPLVVYYNKDLLAGSGYITPPLVWDAVVQTLPRFLKKTDRTGITQTALPLGAITNINHFKSILVTLFLQTGNAIVVRDTVLNRYTATIAQSPETQSGTSATAQALLFYTNFANPTSALYSWTKSLPSSLEMFTSGRSAFYIGRASELFTIQSRNPNLSFDVIEMFQPTDAVRPVSHGNFTAVAIIAKTTNFTGTYSVLSSLSTSAFTDYLSKGLSLPPARRDLLAVSQTNPYVQVFFKSALNAFGWLDMNPSATTAVFRDMIQAVDSGRLDPSQAIYEASRDLQSVVQ